MSNKGSPKLKPVIPVDISSLDALTPLSDPRTRCRRRQTEAAFQRARNAAAHGKFPRHYGLLIGEPGLLMSSPTIGKCEKVGDKVEEVHGKLSFAVAHALGP